MGLREKARKSLEGGAEAEDRVTLKVDVAALDAEATTEQLRKTRVAVDTKEASLKKREAEVESLVASLNKHDREIAEREQAVSIAQDKLDAEARVVREAGREVQQARAKLDTREAELAERGKAFRDQANQRTTEVERDLEGAKKDLAKALHDLKSARADAIAARKEYQEKEIVLTTEMTRARGSVDQEKEKSSRLKAEIEELRKRVGRAGELSEKESDLKAKWAKFETEKKELTDHETRVAAFEKKLEAREGEAKTATLAAVEGSAEAEKALKEVRERERTLEKLERKIDGERDKLEEQAKAKQQAHAQEVDELRKLLQTRDREIAKHEKELESQQIAARSEAEAQERRGRRPNT